MPKPLLRRLAPYACAVISIAVATWIRAWAAPFVGTQFPFASLAGAVLLTAWFGGTRPALLAVFLGVLAADYFLLPPRGLFNLGIDQLIGLLFYSVVGIGAALLGGTLHRQRREAEENSVSRFRHYIDSAPYGILVADGEQRFVDANPAAAYLLGYDIGALVGLPVRAIHLDESLGRIADSFAELQSTGYNESEYELVRADGTTFTAAFRAVRLDNGLFLGYFKDVTEDRLLDRALREERDLFARIVSTVPVVVCSFQQRPDGTWAMPFANARIEDIYAVPVSTLMADASPIFSAIHGADVDRVRSTILESAANLTPWTCEWRVNHPERGELWIEGQSIPSREPDGSVLWHGYIADISIRKRTEEALRTSETRLRLLVEGIHDYAIFMLDPEGRILTWNSGAQMMYGYAESDIVGQPYATLFPLQSVASGKAQDELKQAAAYGKSDPEGWRVRRNGSQFWATGSLAALYDTDGRKILGFAHVTRDISVKRRNDELLHSVLDHTLDAIITIDEHGIVLTINHAGEQIFGHSTAAVVGRNVSMLMPENHRVRHDRYIDNYLETGKAQIIGIGREVRGLRKDGTTFPMDLAITEFRLDDHRYFVGIVRDVSDKKKLEAQLFQSQKMEAFGQLAGGVAHDFNNLLTLINGYSQMLQRMVPDTDAKQKMLGQIFRAGQRAAALTQQLLAFSRQQVLEPKVIDINAVVSDIDSMLRRLIGEDITLATVLKPDLSTVRADPGQIEQVIMNLAVNARDAMPQGGKLTIETAEVILGDAWVKSHADARPGPFVMISISDTGTGMTPEVRARVFEPFFTTKGVGKGTGLGLAVAHGIIKQTGGTIDVYSEPGVGTTFKICLPALRVEAAPVADSTLPVATSGTETLLLVEDDESVREFVGIALQSFGYTVLTAADGMAAIELFAGKGTTIDLLITDVVMPEMSGRVLAESLLAGTPGLKVLFLSGYTDDAVVRHGILKADVAFLQKPFTPDALGRKVREVLDAGA